MSESGDRAAFLAAVRARAGEPATAAGPHPPPPPPETVPTIGYRNLDGLPPDAVGADLVEVFAAQARAAEAEVTVVDGMPSASVVASIVEAHGIERAVSSTDDGLEPTVAALRSAGVAVQAYERDIAAAADLAVTSATHGLASTGSVVVDSASAGSRAVSLLPRIHLCVLPAERIVPTHAHVLRHQERPLPSCRVVITGPSRTGDIEQRLTLGAHGPVALHVLVHR